MQTTTERVAAETAPRAATYATILVHAEPGTAGSSRVEAAARLARDLDATLPAGVPFDATHITLATSALEDGELQDAFVALGSLMGQLRIKVESVSHEK